MSDLLALNLEAIKTYARPKAALRLISIIPVETLEFPNMTSH